MFRIVIYSTRVLTPVLPLCFKSRAATKDELNTVLVTPQPGVKMLAYENSATKYFVEMREAER